MFRGFNGLIPGHTSPGVKIHLAFGSQVLANIFLRIAEGGPAITENGKAIGIQIRIHLNEPQDRAIGHAIDLVGNIRGELCFTFFLSIQEAGIFNKAFE